MASASDTGGNLTHRRAVGVPEGPVERMVEEGRDLTEVVLCFGEIYNGVPNSAPARGQARKVRAIRTVHFFVACQDGGDEIGALLKRR